MWCFKSLSLVFVGLLLVTLISTHGHTTYAFQISLTPTKKTAPFKTTCTGAGSNTERFSQRCISRSSSSVSTALKYSNENHRPPSSPSSARQTIRRTSIAGISVSPRGFLILLSTVDKLIPLRVTTTDVLSATSAEALTLCQLLSGVDMAGAILQPDVFNYVVGLYCSREEPEEDEETKTDDCISIEDELGLELPLLEDYEEEEEGQCGEDNTAAISRERRTIHFVSKFIKQTLSSSCNSFEEANSWQRSRVIFPKLSLDQVIIDLPEDHVAEIIQTEKGIGPEAQEVEQKPKEYQPLQFVYTLECRIDGDQSLSIPIYTDQLLQTQSQEDDSHHQSSQSILQSVLYEYQEECSGSFLAMALALRYKCPIVITERALQSMDQIQSDLEETNSYVFISTTTKDDEDTGTTTAANNKSQQRSDMETRILERLPQWRSVQSLETQSQRVVSNIEQGFQLTQMQSALKIAREKGDDGAVQKIQLEIEKILNKAKKESDDDDDIDDGGGGGSSKMDKE